MLRLWRFIVHRSWQSEACRDATHPELRYRLHFSSFNPVAWSPGKAPSKNLRVSKSLNLRISESQNLPILYI